MSLRRCNYCHYQELKRDAHGKGEQLVRLGNRIYIFPKNVRFEHLTKQQLEPYFAAWFMELTDRCVC